MKILKVYDKINRLVLESNSDTGIVYIKEHVDSNNYFYVIINTKLFKLKRDKIAYLSYVKMLNGKISETLDLTCKYILYKKMNEQGLLICSEKIHIKENKSILTVNRIYDELNEFIEIENHRGKKTINFKVKKQLLNKL